MNRYMPLVILVVLGQSILAYLLVNRVVIRRLMGPAPEEITEIQADIAIGDEPERIYRGMGAFILTPADTAGTHGLRFVRTEVTLGVAPAGAHSQLEAQNPRLRDIIIGILTAKEVSELDSPEDREFIKDEIRFAVNRLLTVGEVLQVNFVDFVIQ